MSNVKNPINWKLSWKLHAKLGQIFRSRSGTLLGLDSMPRLSNAPDTEWEQNNWNLAQIIFK